MKLEINSTTDGAIEVKINGVDMARHITSLKLTADALERGVYRADIRFTVPSINVSLEQAEIISKIEGTQNPYRTPHRDNVRINQIACSHIWASAQHGHSICSECNVDEESWEAWKLNERNIR